AGTLVVDVLNSSGTLTANIINTSVTPDASRVISLVLNNTVWTDYTYSPSDLLRITYNSVVLSIERMEVVVSKQGLFGALVDPGEINLTGDYTFGSVTVGSGANTTTFDGINGILKNFTESNYSYNTKTGVKLAANNAATDVDLVLSPKGTGAILAQQPDGTITGGNNRGINAVDMQMSRIYSAMVSSGNYSVIAGGNGNTASGAVSIVSGGETNKSSGGGSVVSGGITNVSSGNFSVVAGGNDNTSSHIGSVTGGGEYNLSMGDYSIIGGGSFNNSSGVFSIVIGGDNNISSGNYAVVLGGSGNTSPSYGETVLGYYSSNYTIGTNGATQPNPTDRLFSIGNGTDSERSNALTILKNANTTIGGSLMINGNGSTTSFSFPTTRGASGQVLTTNGTGGTNWGTPYTGLINFTESNYTYNTKTGVKLLATNSATDVDFVVSPKGSGAILAQQPDGSSAGGNVRGQNAVDLQTSRFLNNMVASGNYSVIVGGNNNTASGYASTVMGISSTASGDYSTAMGRGTHATGNYSTTMGDGTIAPSGFEIAIGRYNEQYIPVNTSNWDYNDRLFVIGNGASDLGRSNALTIMKNANTTIGGSLTINGNGTSYAFPTGRGTTGQVLTSDGSGGTNWNAPTAGTETDPVWTTASSNYYTKTNMQTSGGAQLHFNNLTNKPTTVSGYGITDAMTTAHAANGITSTNISDWNSAYGWGDHEGLYRPVEWVPDWKDVIGKPFRIDASPLMGDLLWYDAVIGRFINWTPNYLTSVTGTAPIVSSGGTAPVISISAATTSAAGSMSAADKTKLDGSTHTIGDSYGGGIVFYVYDGGRHGLIAATTDQSLGIQWGNGTDRATGTTGDGLNAGEMNTAMIVATQMADNQAGNFAAKVCADYSVTVSGVTYGDWYLPSKYELNLLYLQKSAVGVFATNHHYWSSSEYIGAETDSAWSQFFGTGSESIDSKGNTYYVRAIRAF
ncbi:MAG: DUF1566 domain-containing protein, partial [bacterium]